MGVKKGQHNGRCSICLHPDRYRIELALANGVSRRIVGEKFSVSADSAKRHYLNHMPAERRMAVLGGPLKLAELAEKATEENISLIDHLVITRNALQAQFFAAIECGDRHGASLIAGRLLESLRLIGQVSGEMSKAGAVVTNTIAIMASPVMADLQQMLIQRLAPFPEARAAVIDGLEEMSRKALPAGAGATIAPSPALPQPVRTFDAE